MTHQILIGGEEKHIFLNPKYANRHGLIAGATGTGKTISVQCLAESFSDIGVPVFLADVKGDLSGIAAKGKPHPKIDERIERIDIRHFALKAHPCVFWDLFGKEGFPVRITLTELGPTLLSRLLNLNDVQEGVIATAFDFADEEGLLMVDLSDLKTTLLYLQEHASEIQGAYGRIAKSSVAAILRRLLTLENEGAQQFFGEPAIDYKDFIKTNDEGNGYVNVLVADKLIHTPKTYATFLFWLMSELFETLPEVGDADKPQLVLFFDEAHLLFRDTPKAFVNRVEQVVRLIRSKGVGIFFITQSPNDIPENILGQLGNRIQHALRAYTPKDRKTVRAAAQTFRTNPALDTETVITELGVGEALVSVLEEKGVPGIVERTLIRPPFSQIGPIDDAMKQNINVKHPAKGRYEKSVDPESAHEVLKGRAEKSALQEDKQKTAKRKTSSGRRRQSAGEAFIKSTLRSIGSSLGRQLIRGILGSLLKK